MSTAPSHGLVLTDCSMMVCVVVHGETGGLLAEAMDVGPGHAYSPGLGIVVAGVAKSSWRVYGPPDSLGFLQDRLSTIDEPIHAVDLTQGRMLLRLAGPRLIEFLSYHSEGMAENGGLDVGTTVVAPVADIGVRIIRDDLDGGPSVLFDCDRSLGRSFTEAIVARADETMVVQTYESFISANPDLRVP